MLNQLTISNIAIIERTEMNFEAGLNILSGETGAGKSVLIQSIAFALGAKADKGMIRPPARSARVEALFDDDCAAVNQVLASLGVEREEGAFLAISREIWDNGKSIARVNGQSITLAQLKILSAALVDVHGQHEYRYLLDVQRHRGILDAFAGEKLAALVNEADEIAKEQHRLLKQKEEMSLDEAARMRRMDILQYQIQEIEAAGVKSGEEERLENDRRRMANASKVQGNLDEAYDMLYQSGHSAQNQVEQSAGKLERIADLDPAFSNLAERLNTVIYELEDVVGELRSLRDAYEFDDSQLENTETRLAQLKSLMRKYGSTEDAILEFLARAKEEYDGYLHAEENAQLWDEQLVELTRRWKKASKVIAAIREHTARQFSEAVSAQLTELGMEKAQFRVELRAMQEDEALPLGGGQSAAFLFSANLGEALHPLDKVASGGELSRLMLALKTVMADTDAVSCMVFDEIDSGISGNMATVVAQKLSLIARERQVICITHTAQIAAMGDMQYLIEKTEQDGRVTSHVKPLTEDARYLEIARLVGMDMAGATGQAHARQMLAWCREFKKQR